MSSAKAGLRKGLCGVGEIVLREVRFQDSRNNQRDICRWRRPSRAAKLALRACLRIASGGLVTERVWRYGRLSCELLVCAVQSTAIASVTAGPCLVALVEMVRRSFSFCLQVRLRTFIRLRLQVMQPSLDFLCDRLTRKVGMSIPCTPERVAMLPCQCRGTCF